MKREFVFDEALRMLEVTWSSLPKYPRQNELGNLIFIRNELSFNWIFLFLKIAALFERIPDLAPTASAPIPLPTRIKESPYTKVCSLRRQSSSPASSFSLNSSDGPPPTGLHSALKNSRDSQSLCSPSWDRVRMEPDLDDVFVPNHLESLKVVVAAGNHSKPKEESTESPRDPAQANGHDQSVDVVQTASSVEHLSSALSLLLNSKDPEQGLQSVSPSCPLEDSSLQDFEVIGSCEEATESAAAAATATGSNNPTHINYVRSGVRPSLPSPDVLGCGNPFLIFLCLTVLLQHRDSIINRSLDSNEMAMHFDRLVRKHNLERVLSQARTLYYRYLGHFNSQNSWPVFSTNFPPPVSTNQWLDPWKKN
jgi:hypothetical protein